MIDIREIEDIAVVAFKDEITYSNVAELRETRLLELIGKKTDKTKIIINMGKIKHMDSGALGRIVGVYKMTLQRKGVLALTNMNAEISNLIGMVGLNKIIQTFDSEEEAVKKLSS